MRRLRQSDGFTLIELMVVIVIIAILIVIGIPSYLRFREQAQDSAAQQSLAVAQKATFAVALQNDIYPDDAALVVAMPGYEASRNWLDAATPSTGPNEVSLADDAAGRELAMAVLSRSGSCFYLRVSLDGPPVRNEDANAATCVATDFVDGAGSGW